MWISTHAYIPGGIPVVASVWGEIICLTQSYDFLPTYLLLMRPLLQDWRDRSGGHGAAKGRLHCHNHVAAASAICM